MSAASISCPAAVLCHAAARQALDLNREIVGCADVYDRLTPKGRKPQLSTLVITQVVSGLWHGIFPGYALFFVSCAFFFNSSKVCHQWCNM